VDFHQGVLVDGVLVEIDRKRMPHKFVFSLEGRRDVQPCRVSVAKFSTAQELQEFARAWASLQKDRPDER
jgi:hypothetical protein